MHKYSKLIHKLRERLKLATAEAEEAKLKQVTIISALLHKIKGRRGITPIF